MAAHTHTTGARSRAPGIPAASIPSRDILDCALAALQDIQGEAEMIDALALGVEVMIENQRAAMRDQNAGSFLLDNELWQGMAVLLSMTRSAAVKIGERGEAIERAAMSAGSEGTA